MVSMGSLHLKTLLMLAFFFFFFVCVTTIKINLSPQKFVTVEFKQSFNDTIVKKNIAEDGRCIRLDTPYVISDGISVMFKGNWALEMFESRDCSGPFDILQYRPTGNRVPYHSQYLKYYSSVQSVRIKSYNILEPVQQDNSVCQREDKMLISTPKVSLVEDTESEYCTKISNASQCLRYKICDGMCITLKTNDCKRPKEKMFYKAPENGCISIDVSANKFKDAVVGVSRCQSSVVFDSTKMESKKIIFNYRECKQLESRYLLGSATFSSSHSSLKVFEDNNCKDEIYLLESESSGQKITPNMQSETLVGSVMGWNYQDLEPSFPTYPDAVTGMVLTNITGCYSFELSPANQFKACGGDCYHMYMTRDCSGESFEVNSAAKSCTRGLTRNQWKNQIKSHESCKNTLKAHI